MALLSWRADSCKCSCMLSLQRQYLLAHAGPLLPGSAGYVSMQHSLAGVVAARLGINSSHVVLRSINPASAPSRRFCAVSSQVSLSAP